MTHCSHQLRGYLSARVARGLLLTGLLASSLALAAPPSPPDFSGVYDCVGKDHAEGEYKGVVTLKRVAAQGEGPHTAYSFQLEVPGFGTYPGHAAAWGREMAIYFANTDPATQDFGTGIARFRRNGAGKWTFTKFYYEPAYHGGNHGTEVCVAR